MGTKLAVLFPGTGYTCRHPLLRACAEQYAALSYDVLPLDYGDVDFSLADTVQDAVALVKPAVLAGTEAVDFSRYDDVVFVEKSLGTAVAPWLDALTGNRARRLSLTPIPEALPTLTGPDKVIAAVLGDADPHLTAAVLEAHCRARNIPCHIIRGVGHKLAFPDDEAVNATILRKIATLCK